MKTGRCSGSATPLGDPVHVGGFLGRDFDLYAPGQRLEVGEQGLLILDLRVDGVEGVPHLVGDGGDEISFGGVTEEDYDEIGNEETPIVKLVNKVIANAVGSRASDIHFEPMEKKVRVRFRIDGQCIEQEPLPKKLQGSIISRLKIMSKMRPEENRVPQDGNIKMRLAKRGIDFRVNALPATHG